MLQESTPAPNALAVTDARRSALARADDFRPFIYNGAS